MPRDVQVIKFRGLEAQDMFEACSPHLSGEIHAMGSVYAVIWYGVFQRALTRGGLKKEKMPIDSSLNI